MTQSLSDAGYSGRKVKLTKKKKIPREIGKKKMKMSS